MTKICFLSSAHPKFDKRVFKKEAVWLAKAGHEVIHLCPDEVVSDTEAENVRIVTYTRRGGLIGRMLAAPRLFRHLRRLKADVLHANELDSWLIALVMKLFTGTRVVFDVHEFYPSMFAETRMPRFLAPLTIWSIRLLYRLLGPYTNLIVLANRHIMRDFPEKFSHIIYVENFAALETVKQISELDATQTGDGQKEQFTLIHVGLLSTERGSIVVQDAFEKIADPAIKLELIGRLTDMPNEDYRAGLAARGLGSRVKVIDWLPYETLLEHLLDADAGFVFFQSGSETNAYGLPHKLFDYMAAGLPVLVSKYANYVAEIVTEAECGLILDSEDAEEVAAKILWLQQNPEAAIEMGRKGRDALKSRFNWDSEFRKLSDFYAAA